MKALTQIKTTGEIIQLHGHDCSLEQAQGYVGGLIENAWTSTDKNLTMFCNEEGLLEGLPVNNWASSLIGTPIVGDVLIVKNEKKDFQ